MALLYPNTFQTHNFYVDKCLHLLTGDEWKVLTYAIRRIVGFNKVSDHISLTRFEQGTFSEKQNAFVDHGVGLSRPTIVKALASLTRFGFLIEVKHAASSKKGVRYNLQLDDELIDFAALEARQNAKNATEQERVKTRKERQVVNAVYQKQLTPFTSSGKRGLPEVVNAVYTQNQEETQGKQKRYPEGSGSQHDLTTLPLAGAGFANAHPCNNVLPATPLAQPTIPTLTHSSSSASKTIGFVNQQLVAPEKSSSATKSPKTVAGSNANFKGSATEVFEHWKAVMRHPGALLIDKRLKLIVARLKEGYTVETLKQAIDGCATSDYHMGRHKNNTTVYDDIELICRDGGKVEKFVAMVKKVEVDTTEGWVEYEPDQVKVLEHGIKEVGLQDGKPFYRLPNGAGCTDYQIAVGMYLYNQKKKEKQC